MIKLDEKGQGRLLVDVLEYPWPDHMGNPKADPDLFAAWSMGFFGPFTFPRNLERSVQQAWSWPDAKRVVSQHRSFIRINATHTRGPGDDQPVIPLNYDPLAEMSAITQVATALCRVPGALCYFNPNGESLCTPSTLQQAWEGYRDGGSLPLDIWTNRRLYNLQDRPGWVLMDTVGMEQFDSPAYEMRDHEVYFPSKNYDPNEVALFLLNTSYTFLKHHPQISDGTTTDGPGGIWRVQGYDQSLVPPPRPVWRWSPET